MSDKYKIKRQKVHQHGPGGMIHGGEKANNFKGTMKKLMSYMNEYKLAVIIVFIFAAASSVFSIVGPKILGKATTKLFEGIMGKISGSGSGIDFDYIARILIILAGLYALSTLFSYIQGWLMSGVSMKVSYKMRKEISKKINKLPLKYFDGTNQGEVLSRVTNDVDTVSQTLNQSLTQIITSITTVVGVLVMMLSISFTMTLVALCIIPLSMGIMMFIIKQSQKYFKEQQDYLGHVNGHVEEMYGGHIVMRAFNGEEDSIEKFDGLNNTLYKSAWKSQFLSGMIMPIMNFVSNLGYVGVCVLGGWLAIKKTIEVGDIQAFIQYVRFFTQPITQIANISNILQQTAASAERVFEFLEEEEAVPETCNPVKLEKVEGYVEFKNVRFGYNPDKVVINDFSAKIKPGEKVAIVGPTGAGKTTMVKLLMRFYDINSGSILVDGHDIRDFRRNDLRSIFGMVLQDTWLYNGSIMENIRYGRLNASDEEVKIAAKAAHVDSFVRTLPGGYDMILNEEASNVSQGQKQLLTIARAILADPKVLILDEATSSVDTRTEVRIKKAMDNLMRDRTSFIIAHRLSTVRDADLILVMNNGDIVEQGNHEELLKKKGFYANLYNSQFEDSLAAE
ncbi:MULTISPECIES: ABC transporter ATP-binding protein [Clostridium]|uniref:ABC transporter ATP-binding protein n=3 Tax=Clostridium TaxID=1485 RepID=D8GI91_CLOLD|nr:MULTISPECIES: ABC transporter ATP-binding protein [Clostridium]ADK14953.1 predicted ABC-type transporter, ATPase and permease component [Clostridium ljungdahlii DSM 13528]AGY78226.1 ABC transporter ATP-binding protein/permease [Clostridium autoethanogenum DSM 10061]ALU38358.1 Xenobiotic-transporting ATPase [Clostridium autoethanogenum DSM 10061]OAA87947.1 putative ABC transporter ATP-binding protein [Clostridium ljungdahlii DSM 13528]OVY51121.1 putative ABC transporter ATP-binding protein [